MWKGDAKDFPAMIEIVLKALLNFLVISNSLHSFCNKVESMDCKQHIFKWHDAVDTDD